MGTVLSEALDLYRRFFGRFFLIALAVFAVVDLAAALADEGISNGSGGTALLALISIVLAIVGSFWVQGAVVFAVQDVRDGRVDTSLGEIFSHVRSRLGTLVLAGVLAGLGIALGLLLLVVPGLVLMTWWALIAPVVVLEQLPAGAAFSRSRQLVRGHGWSVFGIVVVVTVVSGVASVILGAVFSFLPGFLSTWIGGAIASAIVTPWLAIALTVAYFRLSGGEGGEGAAAPA